MTVGEIIVIDISIGNIERKTYDVASIATRTNGKIKFTCRHILHLSGRR